MENQDILKHFPQEKVEKIETLQEIIYILSKVSEEAIDSSYASLSSLKIFENAELTALTARKLVVFYEIYPFHINTYTKFAKLIVNDYPNFKELLISQIFHRFYFSYYGPEQNFVLYALYCCYKQEVYQIDEIISKFKTCFREKYECNDNNILFFIYFSPELKENDLEFYKEMVHYSRESIIPPVSVSDEVRNYLLNDYLNKLEINNFELLRKYRDDAHVSENPLFSIIYHDDVDKLRDFLANPRTTGNEIIEHSIISPYREFANNLSLISTAAVFSSVNCFKYLLLHGSRIDGVLSEMGTLAQDTIVGGNVEIIRFAQQNRIDFGGALTTCSFYFRNDLFEWIFETQDNNIEELIKVSPAGSTVFCQACYYGNLELVLKCIEMGVNLNAEDIDSYPLLQASIGGSSEVVDILLSIAFKNKEENQNETKDDNNEKEQQSKNKDENDAILIDNYTSDGGDDSDFWDHYFILYNKISPFLNIESKIPLGNVYKSLSGSIAKGHLDCVKVFIEHGMVPDVYLLCFAINDSRYSTLSYLLEKCKFELDPSNEHSISFIVYCEIQSIKKTFKNIYNKNSLYNHILKALLKQNSVRVAKLILEKIHFDSSNENEKQMILSLLMTLLVRLNLMDSIDVFIYLLLKLNDIEKMQVLANLSKKELANVLKYSCYKDEIKKFFIDYETNNKIESLSETNQKLFNDVKEILISISNDNKSI